MRKRGMLVKPALKKHRFYDKITLLRMRWLPERSIL